jgi:hypothetical protein
VIIRRDHNALQYLLRSKNLSNHLARYVDFIADYDLEIHHLPDIQNTIVDHLSRLRPCETDANSPLCKRCRACFVPAELSQLRNKSRGEFCFDVV